jgi:hypothetical protein
MAKENVGSFPEFGAVLNDFRFWLLELDDRMSSKFLAHGHVTLRAIWLRANNYYGDSAFNCLQLAR